MCTYRNTHTHTHTYKYTTPPPYKQTDNRSKLHAWCRKSIICLFCLKITQRQNVFIITTAIRILFLLLLLKGWFRKNAKSTHLSFIYAIPLALLTVFLIWCQKKICAGENFLSIFCRNERRWMKYAGDRWKEKYSLACGQYDSYFHTDLFPQYVVTFVFWHSTVIMSFKHENNYFTRSIILCRTYIT